MNRFWKKILEDILQDFYGSVKLAFVKIPINKKKIKIKKHEFHRNFSMIFFGFTKYLWSFVEDFSSMSFHNSLSSSTWNLPRVFPYIYPGLPPVIISEVSSRFAQRLLWEFLKELPGNFCRSFSANFFMSNFGNFSRTYSVRFFSEKFFRDSRHQPSFCRGISLENSTGVFLANLLRTFSKAPPKVPLRFLPVDCANVSALISPGVHVKIGQVPSNAAS